MERFGSSDSELEDLLVEAVIERNLGPHETYDDDLGASSEDEPTGHGLSQITDYYDATGDELGHGLYPPTDDHDDEQIENWDETFGFRQSLHSEEPSDLGTEPGNNDIIAELEAAGLRAAFYSEDSESGESTDPGIQAGWDDSDESSQSEESLGPNDTPPHSPDLYHSSLYDSGDEDEDQDHEGHDGDSLASDSEENDEDDDESEDDEDEGEDDEDDEDDIDEDEDDGGIDHYGLPGFYAPVIIPQQPSGHRLVVNREGLHRLVRQQQALSNLTARSPVAVSQPTASALAALRNQQLPSITSSEPRSARPVRQPPTPLTRPSIHPRTPQATSASSSHTARQTPPSLLQSRPSRIGPLHQRSPLPVSLFHTAAQQPSTPRQREQRSDDILDLLAAGGFSSPSILNRSPPAHQHDRQGYSSAHHSASRPLFGTPASQRNNAGAASLIRTTDGTQQTSTASTQNRSPFWDAIARTMPQTRRRTAEVAAHSRHSSGDSSTADSAIIIGSDTSGGSNYVASSNNGINASRNAPAGRAYVPAAAAASSSQAPAAGSQSTTASGRKRRRSGEPSVGTRTAATPTAGSSLLGSMASGSGSQQRQSLNRPLPEQRPNKRVKQEDAIILDDLFGDDDGDVEVVNLTNVDRPKADGEEEEEAQEEEPAPPANMVKLAGFQCVICMDDVTGLTVTHCGHLFCSECLHSSLHIDASHRICPICRQKIEIRTTSRTKTFRGFFPLELKLMTKNRQDKQPARGSG